MNPLDFMISNVKYLIDTVPGSIVDTVTLKQPKIQPDETVADLHVHPYITSVDDLVDTMRIMHKNNVGLCAITTHGKGDSREMDYWTVRQMVKDCGIEYEDLMQAFRITWQDRILTFIGAYEMYTKVEGVKGKVDVLSLMPDKGFEDKAKQDMAFIDFWDLNNQYNAMTIGAHPYTLWDPYGPGGFFRFRLATVDEREAMKVDMFPMVMCVDLVASNAAWMVKSNELLAKDFWKSRTQKPLANSDAHAKNSYARNEIGRAGNIFRFRDYEQGIDLRAQLENDINLSEFETYLNHTPSLQFLISIALDNPPEGFP